MVTAREGTTVGPVLVDGSMTLQVERETSMGLLKSKEYEIDGDSVNAQIQLDEKNQEDVIRTINEAMLSIPRALTAQDASLFENFSESWGRMITRIGSLSEDYMYYGFLDSIRCDLDAIKLSESEDRISLIIDTEVT